MPKVPRKGWRGLGAVLGLSGFDPSLSSAPHPPGPAGRKVWLTRGERRGPDLEDLTYPTDPERVLVVVNELTAVPVRLTVELLRRPGQDLLLGFHPGISALTARSPPRAWPASPLSPRRAPEFCLRGGYAVVALVPRSPTPPTSSRRTYVIGDAFAFAPGVDCTSPKCCQRNPSVECSLAAVEILSLHAASASISKATFVVSLRMSGLPFTM